MKNWLLRGESVGFGVVLVLKWLGWCLMPLLGPFLQRSMVDGCTEMLVLWCMGVIFIPVETADPLHRMALALLFAYVVWWVIFGIQHLWDARKKTVREEAQKGGV